MNKKALKKFALRMTVSVISLLHIMTASASCDVPIEVNQTLNYTCGQSYQGSPIWRDTVVFQFIIVQETGICDTLFQIYIDVHGNDFYQQSTRCDGEVLIVGLDTLTSTGQYTTSILRPNTCDSVVHTSLIIQDPISTLFTFNTCAGDNSLGFPIYRDTIIQQTYISSLGCDSITTIEIDVFSAEALTITGNTIACIGQTANLTASLGYTNYNWSDGQTGRAASFSESGTYTLTTTGNTGCLATRDIDILISDPYFEVSKYDPICEGDFGTAEASELMGGVQPYSLRLDNFTFTDSVFRDLSPGLYTVGLTDSIGCTTQRAFEIESATDNQLVIFGLPNNTHPNGTPISLTITGIDSLETQEIKWLAQGDFSCSTCLSTQWTPIYDGSIEVEITTQNDCILTASSNIALRERNKLFVPSAFSPNGDDINDTLIVYSADNISEIENFVLADRWGNIIKNRGPDSSSNLLWDGMNKGQAVDPGVYVYHLQVRFANGGSTSASGEITLVR